MVGRTPGAGGLLRQGDARTVDFGQTSLEVRVRNAGEVVQVAEIGAIEAMGTRGEITRYAEVDEEERTARATAGNLAEGNGVEQRSLHGRATHNHVVGVSLT